MTTDPRQRQGETLRCAIFLVLVGLLLLASSVAGAQAPAKANRAAAEQLTQSLMALHYQYQSAPPDGKAAMSLQLHTLAAKRQQVLSSLMASDPGAVLAYALPDAVRSAMPQQVRDLVEQRVTMQGKVLVAIEDGRNYSRLHYGLIVTGRQLELHFAGAEPANWLTDMKAQISGVMLGNDISLTLSDTSVLE